ncbi:hypothetical protein BASA60_002118 [Batrachochytrium salamandrivorans]|nr:hypothetical protein BASA60_002118 [Batrachochytrium salamandrivorans]KAH9248645.1 hypothetical protein BASA81_013675 [Batrachochytrium salamandrivorans]KAH9275133.1 hypothetical protein BASA83_002357 [Batrachochytrium salamandrivorans]
MWYLQPLVFRADIGVRHSVKAAWSLSKRGGSYCRSLASSTAVRAKNAGSSAAAPSGKQHSPDLRRRGQRPLRSSYSDPQQPSQLIRPAALRPVWSVPSFSTDILIYRNHDNRLLRLAYLAAGIQVFMWLNIAELAWTYMQEVTTDDAGIETTTQAATLTRVAISGLCGISSLIFPGLVHYFATRRVRSMTILKGGKNVVIENAARFGTKIQVFKRVDLVSSGRIAASLNEPVLNASGLANQIYLKAKHMRTGFILEKSGEFPDPHLYDYLFAK